MIIDGKCYPVVGNGNSKLGISIASVNMPLSTCAFKCPGCYANKHHFAMASIKLSLERNLIAYKDNPEEYFRVIHNKLEMIPYKFFRWHSSGDIVDTQYLDLMFKLARKHKGTQFLCFTKKYGIVNEYLVNHKKPSNLVLVLSAWGTMLPDNPHNLPMAFVKGIGGDELIPENANECHGNCGECVNTSEHCWRMQKGEAVVFKKH